MNITKISIRRPITIMMAVLIAILLGSISLSRLPVNLMPSIEFPVAVVSTEYDGAGPKEIESLVTKPLEGTLGTVSNIKNIESISSNESSLIILEFNDGTDMDFAALDIREKVDLVKDMLPEGVADPMVLKLDPNMAPVMEVGISGAKNLVELKNIAQDKIIDQLERIEGVASVSLIGGKEKEISINLISEKMKGYGISINQVSQLLRSENFNLPGGKTLQGNKNLLIRTVGEFDSINEIRNLPISTSQGIVHLRDFAVVKEKYKDPESYTLINGNPGIKLLIQKQSTANTVKVADKVNTELKDLESKLKDINFSIILDSSKYINRSISNVSNIAIIGGLLAVFILFIFLRNIRSTIIVAIAIPVSVITTFALMYFNDLTMNLISLGGLALGIGMLVDNSIVVLENIYRHRESGKDCMEAADFGTSEVGMAVLASTLTTVSVFLPVVFVEGVAAKIFKDLALTVTFSLLASLAVALTFVPMLASRILKVEKVNHNRFRSKLLDGWMKILNKLTTLYKKLLHWSIYHRKTTVAVTLSIFIGTLSLLPFVGMEFFPQFDEGRFEVSIVLPQGTVLEETSEVVNKVEKQIRTIPEVKEIFITVGGDGSMLGTSSSFATNQASITGKVGSVKGRERSTSQIVDELRQKTRNIPGAEISMQSSSNAMGSHGMGGSKPINIQISGSSLEKLENITDDVVDIVDDVKGTREVEGSFEEAVPEAQIKIKRNKASMYGINVSNIAQTVRSAFKGKVSTQYKFDGDEIDVRISYDSSKTKYLKDIDNLFVKSPSGVHVPLSEITEVNVEQGPTQITRKNQKRIVTVEAGLVDRDLKSAISDIEAKLSNYNFPEGYDFRSVGEYEEMMDSFESLGLALILAIIFVYMILASQFESLLQPFIIMFSVPLALTGAILGLFVTGSTFCMPAFIGLIILSGIIVNNAIVLIDYINKLRERGYERDQAILEAGPVRLRPILMTTLTTVLGMAPLALGFGEGSEAMVPLAMSVIGGLCLSTLLTLVVIPVIYMLFDNLSVRFKSNKKQAQSVNL